MPNIITKQVCEGVNLTYIPEQKFKTALISFSMITPMDKQNVSANAIIPNLMGHSCKKYPSLLEINTKLEELYGACAISKVSKLGDKQILTIAIQSVGNSYIPDASDNILEITKLLNEMVFNPNTQNNSFAPKEFFQEKRQLIEDIESELNDKRVYANRKCTEIMCQNEKFGINSIGTIEGAQNLDEKSVFKEWKNLLKSSHIEIMAIGSCNHELIFNEFKKSFDSIERTNSEMPQDKIVKDVESIKEISEHMDVVQCKLVMGFRTRIAKPDKETEAVKVMSALLGGTPQSKLFLNVREKLSLCYYCSSKYVASKGILFIDSGVEQKNTQKAKKEILNQIEDIKLGNFSDTELTETKMYLSQAIEKTKDNLGALHEWYCGQSLDDVKYSPDEMIEKINKVQREDVINAAQKLELDTVYTLLSKESEKSES